MDRPIVVLDTETATRHLPPHLIEIGAVRVIDGEIVDHFESLVRPQVPIDPAATAIHGITDDHVRDAPGTREVLERFSAWLGADWMAAHRAPADATVLGFEYRRYRLTPPPGPILDSLVIARRLVGDAPDHKLETLCQHLDIEVDVQHRALADAVSCWKVLEACLERLGERRPVTVTTDPSAGDDAPMSIAPLSCVPTSRWSELINESGALATIAAGAPRAVKLPPRLRALEAACDARERVTLVYGEGREVSRLQVEPLLLYRNDGKGYLEAECVRSGVLKTYRLDRIQSLA